MKKQLYIPKKLNVGFNVRKDTYTGLLAYVTYWDDKGKLRKESSWNSWRQKVGDTFYCGFYDEDGRHQSENGTCGPEVEAREIENVPTEGFVMNKDIGGSQRSYGWNPRREKIRVYDPRGFEFEITVANMLFILQETNSIVGKGLEGEFVYSWSGKDLVLLPCCSNEYKESSDFTSLQAKKVGVKDMEVGCVYTDKKQVKLTYLGRFDYFEFGYTDRMDVAKELDVNKRHVFVDDEGKYHPHRGFTKLGTRDTTEPVANYAELMETFQNSIYGSMVTGFELVTIELGEITKDSWGRFGVEGKYARANGDVFTTYSWTGIDEYQEGGRVHKGFYHYDDYTYYIGDNGMLMCNWTSNHRYHNTIEKSELFTDEDLKALTLYDLYVTLESGSKHKIAEYN